MRKQANHVALIVVDVQNGFTPGGNLAVAGADQIIPVINQLTKKFGYVVLTQDGTQVLWPKHCVQGTHDAEFHPELNISAAQLIIRKGFHPDIDSYSAFMEADRKTPTGLKGYLKEHQIDTVYIVGIATDFCVAWTALDAAQMGFKTYVIEDACKAIDLNDSLQHAWQIMREQGIDRIQSSAILS